MKTPDRTTAAAFPKYATGEVAVDSASLQWRGLFVRLYRFPRVVDRFLAPATPEPLITCQLAGSARFFPQECNRPRRIARATPRLMADTPVTPE
jgi:hypothetical protein